MATAYFSNGAFTISSLHEQQNKSFFLSDYEKSVLLFLSEWVKGKSNWSSNTSGSTGTPKTIQLSRDKMEYSAQQTIDYLGLKKGSTGLLAINAAFVGGKMMMARCLMQEMNLIVRTPASTVLDNLQELPKIDFAAFVPLQIYHFLQHTSIKNTFQSIEHILIGGAPLSPTAAEVISNMPNHCWQTYGMTETYSHVALKGLSRGCKTDHFSAVGDAVFSVDEANRLIINGSITDHQPLQTNDVVKLLDERHFEWVGRFDHIINTGGIKVSPEALESKIFQGCANAFQQQAFFLSSLPDDRLGEKIVLYVEGNGDRSSLQSALSQVLDKYEMPKEIIFKERFVYTLTGKINRIASVKQDS